jgi:hypothetical protein
MAHARRFCESFRDRIPNGLVGSVRFDANGDIATSPVTILRVEPGAGTLPTFWVRPWTAYRRCPSSSCTESRTVIPAPLGATGAIHRGSRPALSLRATCGSDGGVTRDAYLSSKAAVSRVSGRTSGAPLWSELAVPKLRSRSSFRALVTAVLRRHLPAWERDTVRTRRGYCSWSTAIVAPSVASSTASREIGCCGGR